MIVLLFFAIGLGAVALLYLAAGLVRLVLRVLGRAPVRFWRRATYIAVVVFPLFVFFAGPLAIGYLGSRRIGTRPDERAYAGPRLDAAGNWIIQAKADLDPDSELSPFAVHFASGDGLALRGFHVPARHEAKFVAVCVHGLFRGALEVERVASMLRDLGGDVLILELRNHGDSGRFPATYGLHEAKDVIAAAAWLRAEVPNRPLIVFGVSLGSGAVALALPEIADVAAVVLDSPMAELLAAADRNLALTPRPGRKGFTIPQPWRATVIWGLEYWSDFSMEEVRPVEALGRLSTSVRALVIGGGDDIKMPPDVVRSVFKALPCEHKKLWLREGSQHGRVWVDDPDGYRARLAALVRDVLGG